MRFVAHVATNKIGSECEVDFEVPDEELAGLDEDQRDDLLRKETEDAIYGAGQVSMWWTEA